MVFRPDVGKRFVAAASTRRISATLLSTPLIRTNFACVISAIMRASVVFPLPGGPYRITDGRRSASIARRNSLPGARMCSWPTNSSSERGRMRVASGAALSIASTSACSPNKSCTKQNTLLGRIVHLLIVQGAANPCPWGAPRRRLRLRRGKQARGYSRVLLWLDRSVIHQTHCGLRCKGPISEKLRWREIAHPPASAFCRSYADGHDRNCRRG